MPVQTIEFADRQHWLALRMQDVTASDVAAVCGVSPYKTPLRVFAEKTGMIPGVEENNAMRRGRWLEPAALMALSEERPAWEVRKAAVYLRDPELRIGATPDLVAHDPEREGIGNVQIKTVATRVFNDTWMADGGEPQVPLHYQLQALTEAKLMGAEWACVVALVVGEWRLDFHLIEVPLIDSAWERIKQEAKLFWWYVDNGMPPELIPRRDHETLRAMYGVETGDSALDLSTRNDLPSLLAERAGHKARMKDLDDRCKEIEAEIMSAMKDSESAKLPGWKITWKTTHFKPRPASDVRVLRINKAKETAR